MKTAVRKFEFRVSIPHWCDWKYPIPNRTDVHRVGFNSSLVRLEDDSKRSSLPSHEVSIPHWCDWKKHEPNKTRRAPEFQFLIGAIGRAAEMSFETGASVSIPHWCDWKRENT